MSLIVQYVAHKTSLPSADVFIKQCLAELDDQTYVDIINECIVKKWGDHIWNMVTIDRIKHDPDLQKYIQELKEKYAARRIVNDLPTPSGSIEFYKNKFKKQPDPLEFLDQENLDETCQQFIEWRAKLNDRNSEQLRQFSLASIYALADSKVAGKAMTLLREFKWMNQKNREAVVNNIVLFNNQRNDSQTQLALRLLVQIGDKFPIEKEQS